MNPYKSKSLEHIEQKLEGLDEHSLRYQILSSAKTFKTSWVELARGLYAVWKDKMYKEWGYAQFDTYTAREIGIRKQTAVKLLKSYYFLEKEEPHYLQREYTDSADAAAVPSYESVNILRLAKGNKMLDGADYANIKREVFEEGRDFHQVKKDLTMLIRQRREVEPEEALQEKKVSKVRRFVSLLKSLKTELEESKLLPAPLIKEAALLIKKLEAELAA